MGTEVERKWRVTRRPDHLDAGAPLRQGYLTRGDDTEVRLRDKAGTCYLTLACTDGGA